MSMCGGILLAKLIEVPSRTSGTGSFHLRAVSSPGRPLVLCCYLARSVVDNETVLPPSNRATHDNICVEHKDCDKTCILAIPKMECS